MELCNIFQSGMVLQRRKPINVYGTGKGHVEVTIGTNTVKGDFKGEKWVVTLPAMIEGGPYTMTVKMNDETKVIENILIGDVIVMAGQSNFQYKINEFVNVGHMPRPVVTPNDNIRTFALTRPEVDWREEFCGEKLRERWVSLADDNLDYWPAIGYFYAIRHYDDQKCPIAIITCYQGASMIQSFIQTGVITGTELDVPGDERYQDYKLYERWNHDGFIYDYMVKRLIPMTLGVIMWYQGEANTSPAESVIYDKLLDALVSSWRKDFEDPTLPFIIFQLHTYETKGDGLKIVQEKQAEFVSRTENTELVVTKDVSEYETIHPKEKEPVAIRAYDVMKKYFEDLKK